MHDLMPEKPDWAVCIGGAAGNWNEFLTLERLVGAPWPGWCILVNDVGVHFPADFHYWVSLHETMFPAWSMARALLGGEGEPRTVGRIKRYCDVVFKPEGPWRNMSSGGLAVQFALEHLHCRRVVCAGIPLTPTQHFAESTERHVTDRDKNWTHADKHFRAWEANLSRLQGKVRSMSGRTRDILGAPTREWLTTRWDWREELPHLLTKGLRILVDGREIQDVYELDADEGWVKSYSDGVVHGHVMIESP